jgi:hypothetical protein
LKKHAEAPLQRTGRQEGNKQAPGCGGAREFRLLVKKKADRRARAELDLRTGLLYDASVA